MSCNLHDECMSLEAGTRILIKMGYKQEDWYTATQAGCLAAENIIDSEGSQVPYLTSGFVHVNLQTMTRSFACVEKDYAYSRYDHLTTNRIGNQAPATLDNAELNMTSSISMAGILMFGFGVLQSGDHVVCSSSVFESTVKLIETDIAKFGVSSTLVSSADLNAWERAIKPNTKLFFVEASSNALDKIDAIKALADLAHKHHILLVVDNSFCLPAIQRFIDWGADLVMNYGDKLGNGQKRIVAGAVCCSQGVVKPDFRSVLISRGICLSPFDSWILLKGIEALKVKAQAQSKQALVIAQWREWHPKTVHGYCPEQALYLQQDQQKLAVKQQSGIGDCVVTKRLGEKTGIVQGAFRFSVGTKEVDDIIKDLGEGCH